MKRALFVCYGGGHVKILLQVLQELARQPVGKISVVNIGLTTAARELRQAGYPAKGFRDYVSSATDACGQAIGVRLAAEMHNAEAGISYEESVAYLGLSMQDLASRVGEPEAWGLFQKLKRMCFCPVTVLERILQQERPDIVVTTNSPKGERAALIAARKLGIPSVRIEDLFGVPVMIRYIRAVLGEDAREVVLPVHPDRVAVMNEAARNNVIAAQKEEALWVEPRNVRVTGQPVLDEASRKVAGLSQRLCREENHLPPDQPILLWATDNLAVDGQILNALLGAFRRNPEWFLVIKLHPGFSASQEESYQRQLLPNMRVVSGGDIHRLVFAADATLTHFTTVGLEAAALGRPLILVDFGSEAEIFRNDLLLHISYRATVPYFRPYAAALVHDLQDLEPAIGNVLTSPAKPRADNSFLQSDGNASARIVELIGELLS